jgi:hypothetical protein
MWRCPKCDHNVEDSFEICWSCGTSIEGVEDPSFVTADDQDAIEEPSVDIDGPFEDPLADFAGTPMPELVECYMASDTVEAKFVADRLMEQGIAAVADRHDINRLMGAGALSGPKVRVRPEDAGRAEVWLKSYRQRRKSQ